MIGERIKALRIQRKITQEMLAKQLFVSPQAVSRWEQGLAVPDTAMLVPLADYFEVSVDYLLREPQQVCINDFVESFEIKCELKSNWIMSYFKNISKYTFDRVEFKIKMYDENDEVIDYKTSSFYDSEPETTKIERTFLIRNSKIKRVSVTVTDCRLK